MLSFCVLSCDGLSLLLLLLSVLMQEISNTLAKLSVYACARLGGYLLTDEDTTPDNPAVKKSLSALLTPYLAKKLSDNSPHEVTSLISY